MAWGLDTAEGALSDALQSWGFGLLVAYKLYETKPLSDSPVSRLEKKRKHLRDILFFLIALRPNNTAFVEGIPLEVIEIVSSPAKRS